MIDTAHSQLGYRVVLGEAGPKYRFLKTRRNAKTAFCSRPRLRGVFEAPVQLLHLHRCRDIDLNIDSTVKPLISVNKRRSCEIIF